MKGALVIAAIVASALAGWLADVVSTGLSAHVVYPKVLRIGQTATDPNAIIGIRSVTVLAFVYPAPTLLGPTTDYAMADVRECAGPKGLPKRKPPFIGPTGAGLWEVKFNAGTHGGAVAGASSLALRQPAFNESKGLSPNRCAQGWLTFKVDGTRPYYVSFMDPYTYWRVR